MNRVFAAASLAMLLVMSCSAPKESVKEIIPETEKKALTATVKILTMNIKHSLKNQSESRQFVSWLKKTGAEIVALQQIDRPSENKPAAYDAVKDVAGFSDMYQFFGKARYFEGFDSGNALFSMYPVRQTAVFQLPVGKGKVRRALSYGVIDIGLKSIGFGSTELDDLSASERIAQVKEILSVAKSSAPFPIVVCGDYHEQANGSSVKMMLDNFFAVDGIMNESIAAEQHIFGLKNSSLRYLSAEQVRFPAKNLSGILVTLEATQAQ